MVSDRLENVTQTIAKLLDGYDIRLRPNFGGKYCPSVNKSSKPAGGFKFNCTSLENFPYEFST